MSIVNALQQRSQKGYSGAHREQNSCQVISLWCKVIDPLNESTLQTAVIAKMFQWLDTDDILMNLIRFDYK